MSLTLDQMVSREVRYCVSGLVSTLANGPAFIPDHFKAYEAGDLRDLAYQAQELASPVLDYAAAARESGAILQKDETGLEEWCCWSVPGDDGNSTEWQSSEADAWRAWCERGGIEPHEREVFEHWAVTDWFAEKLEAAGEKVDRDFAGMAVWARTTSGQSIEMDSVIQRVYADLIAA